MKSAGTVGQVAATVEVRPGARAHHDAPRLTQIKALDGIRGFGVLGNLGYHFGVPLCAGMYVLLDAFFVLSGFLITTLLLVDWSRHNTLSFSSFWTRRARRLVPAMLVVVTAVMIGEAIWGDKANWTTERGNALAVLFYSVNWHFVATGSDYFSLLAQISPLWHLWTLSIEEQFYIVWPLVLWLVMRVWRSPAALAFVAGMGAIASSITMWVVYAGGRGLNHAYYGTDTRCEALLIGAMLAAITTRWRLGASPASRRFWWGAGAVGTVVVFGMAAIAGASPPFWLFHGGFLFVDVLMAILLGSLVFAPRGPAARFFELRVLRWFGAISYGLYLWLVPVKVMLTGRSTHLSAMPLLALRTAVAVSLATISYYFFETPIRRGVWLKAWKAWVVTPVAVAVTGTSALVLGAAAPVASAAELPPTSMPHVPASLVANPLRVLLVGDSNAYSLGLGLSAVSGTYGVEMQDNGMIGCGDNPLGMIGTGVEGNSMDQGGPVCLAPPLLERLVREKEPDVAVMVLSGWGVLDHNWGSGLEHVGQRDYDAHLAEALERSVATLSHGGVPVLILSSPYYDLGFQANGEPWPESDPRRVDNLNAVFRRVAAASDGRAAVVNLGGEVSPEGRYAEYIDGIQIRKTDGIHFTLLGGEWLAPWLLPKFVAVGMRHRAVALASRRPGR